MTDQSLASQLASSLLEIGAVVLQPDEPFTWASGIKSPIYCDNRLSMSYPETRIKIAKGFAHEIRAFSEELPDVIVGTATAGIPHAAWVAQALNLPMAYVRSKAKSHGKQNQIEGLVKEGQRVVVIEDLISTGMSSLKAVNALEELGADVDGVLAIFTYGLDVAQKAFSDANVAHFALTNYEELLKVAVDMEFIDESDLDTLRAWRADPKEWQVGGRETLEGRRLPYGLTTGSRRPEERARSAERVDLDLSNLSRGAYFLSAELDGEQVLVQMSDVRYRISDVEMLGRKAWIH